MEDELKEIEDSVTIRGELEGFKTAEIWLNDFNWIINAIRQQQKQIQELESEIAVLKNVNNSI